MRSWGGLATSEAARSKFMAELQAVVERLAATRQLGSSEVHGLLVAAIRVLYRREIAALPAGRLD